MNSIDTQKYPLLPIALLIGIVFIGYGMYGSGTAPEERIAVTSFEECVAAGYPLAESFPRQCIAPRGSFIDPDDLLRWNQETSQGASTGGGAIARGGCVITGCSGHICAEEDMVTTCEFRPEYACFKETNAICGKQADGKCGWNQTPELLACYQKAFDQRGAPESAELQPQ